MIDAAAVAAGWIWFLMGLLVFFASAGLIVGLFFRQQEVHRFDLVEPGDELEILELPPASPGYAPDVDEQWPDSLP
jgi:hypothetical protein